MKRLTTEEYLANAIAIHGDKWDYSSVEYRGAREFITIECLVHGPFRQRACDHLHQKQGCPNCSHNKPLSQEEFTERSRVKYSDRYTIIEFNGVKQPLKASCHLHGPFTLKKAEVHLKKNGGCPTCWKISRVERLKNNFVSDAETKWLNELKIPIRQHRILLDGRNFVVDGFDPSTNTIYECYGSFWHGHPEFYDPTSVNEVLGVTFGELYQRTLERERLLKEHYNLVSKWVR